MCDCRNIPTSEIFFSTFYHILLNTNFDNNFKQRINHTHNPAFKNKDKNIFNRYTLFDCLFLKKPVQMMWVYALIPHRLPSSKSQSLVF